MSRSTLRKRRDDVCKAFNRANNHVQGWESVLGELSLNCGRRKVIDYCQERLEAKKEERDILWHRLALIDLVLERKPKEVRLYLQNFGADDPVSVANDAREIVKYLREVEER